MRAEVPDTIAVIGAGTMGAGIAQLAALAGARTLLHDPVEGALERGLALVESGLERGVTRGRWDARAATLARDRLTGVATVEELAGAGMVIEAAPERLELKRSIFTELAGVVGSECVLATNTSSLSVTEIAAGVPGAERVVGLHFFNPAPVMGLVEVVAGEVSGARALAVARAVGTAMGKRAIDAADVAGFLVNRCNRPFFLEALRVLEESMAEVAGIDRVARLGGGFRMGPFELMDLIGLDTNHAVAESLFRSGFGEPRYQPSHLQARLVAAGRLGRKTGAGWYEYAETERRGDAEAAAPAAGGGRGRRLSVVGQLPVLDALARAAQAAGFTVSRVAEPDAWLTLCAEPVSGEGPRARLLWDGSLHALDPIAAGFHLLAPLEAGRLIEVTATPLSDPEAVSRFSEFATAIGRGTEAVGDAPGLILGRVVAQLVNEAAFLIGAGLGAGADVDAGLELGANHPRGPLAWSRALGLTHVVGVLDALYRERGEPRYRVAPLLRRCLTVGADL